MRIIAAILILTLASCNRDLAPEKAKAGTNDVTEMSFALFATNCLLLRFDFWVSIILLYFYGNYDKTYQKSELYWRPMLMALKQYRDATSQ